ncbi:unnamed protein product, partial [Ixodes persulcatus]
SAVHAVTALLILGHVRGTTFSQRYDASTPTGSWHPSGPPPSRSQLQSRSGGSYYPYPDSLPPQDIYQNAAPPRQRQPFINDGGGSPESRTVTASITWPRERRVPEPEPRPFPRGDYDDSGAVPDLDPPSAGTRSARQNDQVVRTTLLTPLSHGYVVALAKKSLLPGGNNGGAAGSLHNLRPKLLDSFKEADQPAFLVYVPPNRKTSDDGRRPQSFAARPSQLSSPADVQTRPAPLQRPQALQQQPMRFLVPIVGGDVRSAGQLQFAQQQPLQLLGGGHLGQQVVMYLPPQLQQSRIQEGPASFMIPLAPLGPQATPVQYMSQQGAVYPRPTLDVSAEGGLMLDPALRAQHNEMFRLLYNLQGPH